MKDMSYDARVDGPEPDECELYALGSSPTLPLGDLNLAGIDGSPSIDDMTTPGFDLSIYQPDYVVPCIEVPTLTMGDLARADIDAMPKFQPDPLQPDLTQEPEPYSVDMYTNNLMQPLPLIAQDIPSDAEIAASMYPGMGFTGLEVNSNYLQPDPFVADLQNPDLTQEVTMMPEDRPGEMDDSALSVLDSTPQDETGDSETLVPYKQVFMDQTGDNDHRNRHMNLLLHGLEDPGKTLF